MLRSFRFFLDTKHCIGLFWVEKVGIGINRTIICRVFAVFRGNFPTKVDSQGRIKIPVSYRRIMEEKYGPELYVTSTTGEHVLIYPISEWEQIESKLLEPPKMLPEKLKFLRNTNFYGQMVSMDRQGRVLIPPGKGRNQ